MRCGAQGRDRTTDTAIFSRMLYQLSYLGVPGRMVCFRGERSRLETGAKAAVYRQIRRLSPACARVDFARRGLGLVAGDVVVVLGGCLCHR